MTRKVELWGHYIVRFAWRAVEVLRLPSSGSLRMTHFNFVAV
jgi:hypothetical protein